MYDLELNPFKRVKSITLSHNHYVTQLSISLDIPSLIDVESPICQLVGGHGKR